MLVTAAALSYGAGALAFAVLAVVDRRHHSYLSDDVSLRLPAAVTALWATMCGVQAWLDIGQPLTTLLELARDASWLWFLHTRLRQLKDNYGDLASGLRGLLTGVRVLLVAAVLAQAGMLLWPQPGLVKLGSVTLPLLLAVAGLVMVEQYYRNTLPAHRWGIKFLCMGLGAIFAYDLYMYAEGLLFGALSGDVWTARGAVNALLAPLLWLSITRTDKAKPIALSHRMAFHTVSLVAAGVYLLLMAAAGYYIRVVGGNWGTILQTVFLAGAVLVLVAAAFSGALRAKLRVFLSKHFFRYRYDYREEWLRFTSMLSEGEPGVGVCERSIEAMARLVDSPGGVLWLKQEDGSCHRAANWNWSELQGQVAAGDPFLSYLASRQWVVNLHECREDPDLMEEAQVPALLADNERLWLIIPLLWHERLLGFMALAESMADKRFDWEMSDLLKTAARQAATNLAQMQAAEALTVARQFESFSRASAFVVHDIKNLVAQLSLLLANAAKHKHKPEFQEDMLETIASSVARMNRMLVKLRDKPELASRGSVELNAILAEVMHSKEAYSLKPGLSSEAPQLSVKADREKLIRVLGHLVQNAIEATPYTGRVDVKLSREADWAVIEVADTGVGMDESFIRERLFRPFVSTKGTGMGIGAYECKQYVQELGGDITVTSKPGAGTRFTVRLPVSETMEQEPA
jgi:putative PEP-CTERM system histidine kinase